MKKIAVKFFPAAACIGMALALPYLGPVSSESFLFRGASLPALLLLFSLPALRTESRRRDFIPCLLFALALTLSLSLGSELTQYDGLLPGMGSLLRRLLVPLLSAPFVALLVLRLCHAAPIKRDDRPLPYPFFFCALVLLWLPVWLAYFPGMLNYDFPAEYAQIGDGYSHLHPLLHAAFMNGLIKAGTLLHSPAFGLFLCTLCQVLLFAAALAHACTFLSQARLPRALQLCLLLFFGLHPVFSVMAVSMTKDTLFAAAVLELTLQTLMLLQDPNLSGNEKPNRLLFALSMAGTVLLRNNGIFALLLFVPALLRHPKARYFLAAGAGVTVLALGALTLILRPLSLPTFQLYSLPAQQLVRTYHRGDMTPEERETLEEWYVSAEDGLRLHPHLADAAKGFLDRDRLARESRDFLSLWARVGRRNPRIYLEAFLMLNVGSWYPEDRSYATIYPDVSWNEKGALQTQEWNVEGFTFPNLLPRVRQMVERLCRYNSYLKRPLVPLLFAPAVPLFLLLLAMALLRARGFGSFVPAAYPALGLFLSYLLGPCTLLRYALPLFLTGPLLLLYALTLSKEAKHD